LSSDPVSREAKPGQRLEEAEALAHALECLDPMLRIVFLLRHSEGMGYKRISAILGIPISTAATRLNRARETLQQLLKGERQGS
jgi:RNA polymerase sigma factor (sigma-70 family)